MTILEKDEHAADLEIFKEDNEQLLNQFEREKAARRGAEQVQFGWFWRMKGRTIEIHGDRGQHGGGEEGAGEEDRIPREHHEDARVEGQKRGRPR